MTSTKQGTQQEAKSTVCRLRSGGMTQKDFLVVPLSERSNRAAYPTSIVGTIPTVPTRQKQKSCLVRPFPYNKVLNINIESRTKKIMFLMTRTIYSLCTSSSVRLPDFLQGNLSAVGPVCVFGVRRFLFLLCVPQKNHKGQKPSRPPNKGTAIVRE